MTTAVLLKATLYLSTATFLMRQLEELPNGEMNALVIFSCSGVFAAIAGIAAAIRMAVKVDKWSTFNIISHALNMGCLGMFLSMLAVWYVEKLNPATGYAIIGFCGLCGLIGVPLIDPLAGMIQEIIKRLVYAFGGIKSDKEQD
jgi:hypothetical protein